VLDLQKPSDGLVELTHARWAVDMPRPNALGFSCGPDLPQTSPQIVR
jgi:hypothetical protein